MPPLRRFLEAVHITAAGLWLGSLVTTGAAAAIIFPTVKALNPTLETYPDYTGEHWRLAAGHIAARIFAFGDIVTLTCIMLTGISLALIAASKHTWITAPKITLARLSSLGAALLIAAYSLFILGPRMNTNLQHYWTAAQSGDNPAAETAQQAFMADHAPATNSLAGATLAALALTITAAIAATSSRKQAVTPQPSQLETPDLARTPRSR